MLLHCMIAQLQSKRACLYANTLSGPGIAASMELELVAAGCPGDREALGKVVAWMVSQEATELNDLRGAGDLSVQDGAPRLALRRCCLHHDFLALRAQVSTTCPTSASHFCRWSRKAAER